MSRRTVLFYCQHLLGIGHLSRSLAICRALLDRFDVLFVQGGPDIGRTIDAPGFRHIFLPPLLMREEDSSLYDPEGKLDLDELWARRSAVLAGLGQEIFAAVVVELFPFGRFKFRPEILGLLDMVRKTNPRVRTYCSNRDIMVQKPDQAAREAKIVRILRNSFDHVLLHSDPDFIAMEDTFGSTELIRDQLLYTGYIAENVARAAPPPVRENRILVSLGGGIVGDELALACAGIADRFPDREMQILTGPYTPAPALEKLNSTACRAPNVTIGGFSDDFRGDLSRSELSISLAGYNTLMDILATRTPALVYPYMANREQNMRARALAERDLVGLLYREMLDPDRLQAAIAERLAAPRPDAEIDLTGSETTARIIDEHTLDQVAKVSA